MRYLQKTKAGGWQYRCRVPKDLSGVILKREFKGKLKQQIERVVGLVVEALGEDPVLMKLTRDDARSVRDFMLQRLKTNGKPISPSSVARDLNSLNAVINFAAQEMPLPAKFKNPFSGLKIQGARRIVPSACSSRFAL